MEQWDIYDRNGNPTGSVKNRGEAFTEGEYHLGVTLWIVNPRWELLIPLFAQGLFTMDDLADLDKVQRAIAQSMFNGQ